MSQELNQPQDLVSIIIPVYNTGEYLVKCIQSCIDQSYHNVEIIAVDDCSTDERTKELLREFEAKDPRVHVIWSEENHGQAYARNLGVDNCHGKYFCFIDSDDYFTPEFVEKMYLGLEQSKADFAICDIYNYIEDSSLNNINLFPIEDSESCFNFNAKDQSVISTRELSNIGYLIKFSASCCGKMFNSERYRNSGVRFYDGEFSRHCEDEDWTTLTLIHLENFLVLRFVGMMRRMRNNSVSLPSLSFGRCSIDAAWRRFKIVQEHRPSFVYSYAIFKSLIERMSDYIYFQKKYEDRIASIDLCFDYLTKFGPRYNVNPYKLEFFASKRWHHLLGTLDRQSLPMLYFSLRPVHNSFNGETYYTKRLLENLAAQGLFISSFSTMHSDSAAPLQYFKKFEGDYINFINHEIEREQKSVMELYKKGKPVSPDMLQTQPYDSKAPLVNFKDNGVTYILAKTRPFTRPEAYQPLDLEIIRQGLLKTVRSFFKRKGTGVILFSGGDVLTQTLCAIMKQKGFKVAYLVSCSDDLKFAFKKTKGKPVTPSERYIAKFLDDVLKGIDKEPEGVEVAGARKMSAPVFNTRSRYTFDPHDFDAVFALNPYYAQRFTELHNVPAEYLGDAVNPWVENMQEDKQHNQVIFPNATMQNGLAIAFKLSQRFQELHPEVKFVFVQDVNESLQSDLAKLHVKVSNEAVSTQVSIGNLEVVTDLTVDPITLSGRGAVLLKPMLADTESLCGVYEALFNDVPILGSNRNKLKTILGESENLLELPESTLKDATCLPSDEEIEPWVKALERLIEHPWQETTSFTERNEAFHRVMRSWVAHLYDIVGLPEVHDYEDDVHQII